MDTTDRMIAKKSGFDEGFQPGKGLIPLFGDGIEEAFDFVQRLRVELEKIFPSGADAANDTGVFQNAKVFCNGLASEARAPR